MPIRGFYTKDGRKRPISSRVSEIKRRYYNNEISSYPFSNEEVQQLRREGVQITTSSSSGFNPETGVIEPREYYIRRDILPKRYLDSVPKYVLNNSSDVITISKDLYDRLLPELQSQCNPVPSGAIRTQGSIIGSFGQGCGLPECNCSEGYWITISKPAIIDPHLSSPYNGYSEHIKLTFPDEESMESFVRRHEFDFESTYPNDKLTEMIHETYHENPDKLRDFLSNRPVEFKFKKAKDFDPINWGTYAV